jgi:hypothetical protein
MRLDYILHNRIRNLNKHPSSADTFYNHQQLWIEIFVDWLAV